LNILEDHLRSGRRWTGKTASRRDMWYQGAAKMRRAKRSVPLSSLSVMDSYQLGPEDEMNPEGSQESITFRSPVCPTVSPVGEEERRCPSG
jgi:hypothetical protein